jgi:hypothetical protein
MVDDLRIFISNSWSLIGMECRHLFGFFYWPQIYFASIKKRCLRGLNHAGTYKGDHHPMITPERN